MIAFHGGDAGLQVIEVNEVKGEVELIQKLARLDTLYLVWRSVVSGCKSKKDKTQLPKIKKSDESDWLWIEVRRGGRGYSRGNGCRQAFRNVAVHETADHRADQVQMVLVLSWS